MRAKGLEKSSRVVASVALVLLVGGGVCVADGQQPGGNVPNKPALGAPTNPAVNPGAKTPAAAAKDATPKDAAPKGPAVNPTAKAPAAKDAGPTAPAAKGPIAKAETPNPTPAAKGPAAAPKSPSQVAAAPAQAATPKDPTPAAGKTPGVTPKEAQPKEPQMHVRTFQLRNADLDEVRQVVSQVCAATTKQASPGYPGNQPGPRLAFDARTRTIFARGTEKELQTVASVLSMLDSEGGQPAPDLKDVVVLHLHHAKVGEVMQVLGTLGLNAHLLPLQKSSRILVLMAPEGHAAEVRQVVQSLDVEPRKEAAPKDKGAKKAFPVGGD